MRKGEVDRGMRLRVVDAAADVDAAAWDACANPSGASFDPFLTHAFFDALERSGSATADTGWQPFHLVLERDACIEAIAPMYVKSHSRGEYVFDHAWADAYERAGGDYYPKLQVSVPFTPASGRRLLVRPGGDPDRVQGGLAAGLIELARLRQASSVHLTFLT